MKIWVDDTREPPWEKGCYRWVKSTNEAIAAIVDFESRVDRGMMADDAYIEYLDMDHDAGDYAADGGDYIKVLDWMEEHGYCYDIHIHSMNPVGVQNMRRIIQHNGWKEVK